MRVTVKLVFSASLVAALPTMAQTPTDPPAAPDPISGSLATPDHRGTVREPLVVTKPSEELRRDEFDQQRHEGNEHDTAVATKILAFFTLALWIANIWLVIVTRRTAAEQATHTQQAIGEAKRSADAMRDVAEATKNNATLMSDMLSKQMRAYIQVNIGKSVAQRGDTVFGSWPEIVNVGLTPAKNVSYRLMADILDPRIVHAYPEPERVFTNDATLNPRQTFQIVATVNHRFDPEEVAAISKGVERRLFVWGTITYDDVFGGRGRETRFCHNFVFFDQTDLETGKVEHKVNSYYSTGHNDAT
jgi:hypothetical protein